MRATVATRAAGTRFHTDTAAELIPSWRANAFTPPALAIILSSIFDAKIA